MKIHLLTALMVFCCVLSATASGQVIPAKMTTRDLLARLAEANCKIRAYHIVYDAVTIQASGTPAEVSVHREISASDPSCFSYWSAKQTGTYNVQQDPLQQRLIVENHDAVVEYPADRAFCRLRCDTGLPGSAPREIMFWALGWWPLGDVQAPRLANGTPVDFPSIAASTDYQLRFEPSYANGPTWCELEWRGHDRICIDIARNCLVMARDTLDPASGTIVQRIEAEEPYEIEPGVWGARRFRNFLYDHTTRQLRLDSELFIRCLEVNKSCSERHRQFVLAAGSVELQADRAQQVMPGGEDFLDETLNRLKLFPRFQSAAPVIKREYIGLKVARVSCIVAAAAVAFALATRWPSRSACCENTP